MVRTTGCRFDVHHLAESRLASYYHRIQSQPGSEQPSSPPVSPVATRSLTCRDLNSAGIQRTGPDSLVNGSG